jgi:hypothetical protein
VIAGGGERLLLIRSFLDSLSDCIYEVTLPIATEEASLFSGSFFIFFFFTIGLASIRAFWD